MSYSCGFLRGAARSFPQQTQHTQVRGSGQCSTALSATEHKGSTRTSENSPSETVRKGIQGCLDRQFDRHTKDDMGRKVAFRRVLGLRCKRLRDLSDSFRSRVLVSLSS